MKTSEIINFWPPNLFATLKVWGDILCLWALFATLDLSNLQIILIPVPYYNYAVLNIWTYLNAMSDLF
jgi:hypothetical protein